MKINKSNVDNNQILMNQINKAIDVKITTKNSLDQLLQDKFYKDLIFNNESSANLESSALIVELIRKKNPYLSQTNVVKRYHLLFNTCGI